MEHSELGRCEKYALTEEPDLACSLVYFTGSLQSGHEYLVSFFAREAGT